MRKNRGSAVLGVSRKSNGRLANFKKVLRNKKGSRKCHKNYGSSGRGCVVQPVRVKAYKASSECNKSR